MDLLFVTHNQHKLQEVQALISNHIELIGLDKFGDKTDIEETELTLQGNAKLKAEYGYHKYHINTFSDDTGLEIEALDGRPGVFSARYAGESCSFEDNMNKVLDEMKKLSNRKAQFRTVIALILNQQIHYFEGIVNGKISNQPHGNQGFGYDPIFIPEGYNCTFAEMNADVKNKISHRGLAIEKLIHFLNQLS